MVTIPTIDQFSGTTVMNKVRELIRTFIDFANDVDTALTVTIPQYVENYVTTALDDYYIKTEVDNIADNINARFDDYYTKTEIDDELATKEDITHCEIPLEKFTYNDSPYFRLKYATGVFKITSNSLDIDKEKFINSMPIQAPLYVPLDEFTLPTGVLGVKYDNDTIKLNNDGELYADIAPEDPYGAGDGIDISLVKDISVNVDNDTIKINSDNELYATALGKFKKVDTTTAIQTYILNNIATKDFILIKDNMGLYISAISSSNSAFKCTVLFNNEAYTNERCYFAYGRGTSNALTLYGVYTVSTNGNINVKCYDFDGTLITSSNYNAYIDSSYNVLKPFIISVRSADNSQINPVPTSFIGYGTGVIAPGSLDICVKSTYCKQGASNVPAMTVDRGIQIKCSDLYTKLSQASDGIIQITPNMNANVIISIQYSYTSFSINNLYERDKIF